MASVLEQVATAIADELDDATTLSQSLSPVLSGADFDTLLQDVGELRVDVCPVSCKATLQARGRLKYVAIVDVLIRRKFAAADRESDGSVKFAELAEMLELVEEVGEYFAPCQPNQSGRQLSTLTNAAWEPTSEIKANYSRKMLREAGQFSGWITLAYSLSKVAGT